MFWLLWVIIVGLIAGWAAGKIMGTGGYGTVMDIILGIAGGIVGGLLLRLLGLYSSGGLISAILCRQSASESCGPETNVPLIFVEYQPDETPSRNASSVLT